MSNLKNRALIIGAWVALWVVGLGFYYYSRRQAQLENQRTVLAAAVKAAADREELAAVEAQRLNEKMKDQAKRMQTLQITKGFGAPLSPEEESSPISGLLGARPPADQPIPPIIAAAEQFINTHTLTATSIDHTPYAVINSTRYRVGDPIKLGPELTMRVSGIKDGFVIFAADGHKFKMQIVLSK